jgi:hypothetical protein
VNTSPVALLNIRPEPNYRRDAFESGLKRAGYWVGTGFDTKRVPRPLTREDMLVLWNRKKGTEEVAAEAWEAAGGNVIVVENGYAGNKPKQHYHYAISVHQHNGAGWFPQTDEDRWSRLGIPLKPWQHNEGGHVLICGQRGIGSKLMSSPPGWGVREAKELKAQGKNVRFRPHPGNFVPPVPLTTDLKGAASCLIWSSGAGVTALIEGIPVEHLAPHWICEGADRWCREWRLNHMAHGQWSIPEIETGEPFKLIRERIGEAKWP